METQKGYTSFTFLLNILIEYKKKMQKYRFRTLKKKGNNLIIQPTIRKSRIFNYVYF